MLLSIKTKLKLSKTQENIMSKHAGIARFTYNWGLTTWNNLYKDGLKPNKNLLKKFGCDIILADRWFPSSKTCSSCGYIQNITLKERIYNCTSCNKSIDRDLNAAINLSRLAKA